MRTIVIFVILFIVLIFGMVILVKPQVTGLDMCQGETDKQLDSVINAAKAEKWNRESVCINGRVVVENLKVCYENVQKESFIPNRFVESFVKIFFPNSATLENSKNIHNIACLDFPDYQIK